MKILLVAATPFELAPVQHYLEANFTQKSAFHFQREELDVKILITGVGQLLTAYALGKVLTKEKFHLAINAGVAGAFNRTLQLGDVVHVVTEQLGDLGVEEADGRFTTMHELNLINPNAFPFQHARLPNPRARDYSFLPTVHGLTVNTVHGFSSSIAAAQQRFEADVESMEGAAFFYVCLLENVPFLEIRSISNYVEPRNRENWNLPLAIENLNTVLIELLGTFYTN